MRVRGGVVMLGGVVVGVGELEEHRPRVVVEQIVSCFFTSFGGGNTVIQSTS